MPTDPLDILDLSGVLAQLVYDDSAGHRHVQDLHLAPVNSSTLAWTDSTLATDWTNLQTFLAAYMNPLSDLLPAAFTLSFLQAFPVVGGVVQPTPLTVPAITPVGGGTGLVTLSPAAQLTINFRDDGANAAKLVVLSAASSVWNPNLRSVVPSTSSGSASGLQQLINIATASGLSPAKSSSPIRSHAGGKLLSPAVITSTLNKRLRRSYHLT